MTVGLFASPLEEVVIPNADIPTFFFERVEQNSGFVHGDAPRAVFVSEDGGESLSLAQLRELAGRLAAGLYHDVGVRRGDVVAVVLPNSVYYMPVVLAALMLGAQCTLANPAYTARELRHQLEDSGARHVVADAARCGAVCEAVGQGAAQQRISQVLVVDRVAPGAAAAAAAGVPVRSVFDVLRDGGFPRVALRTEAECAQTPALILYSSGTTGAPKGVLLSHRNLVACALQVMALQRSNSPAGMPPGTGTGMAILPLFHTFGFAFQCMAMPLRGLTTVVVPRFDMQRFLAAVQAHRVTETVMVPPIINALVKLPAGATREKYDLSSVATITVGAAPLGAEIIAMLEALMPHVCVLQGYGMTEASPVLSVNMRATRNIASSGPLAPNMEAKVVDDDGRMLAAGEVGELCFRGPNVMLGYLNRPEDTAATVDADGFLHTGDIGYIGEGCHVFVTDRKKELIKFSGFQVAPAELEALLMQHSRVADCAVARAFDEGRQTEVPRAYLVLDPGVAPEARDKTAQAVVEWLNAQVAYYKQLRGGYVLLDSIPKSAAGKILRRMLA
ncbi:hypothetical protein H4R18_001172 [Coemansia javaensis]|uniref:4-coumarate--CoA ligase n=1 Tax=Coemansia javaensis TaxID=2761396 RepID=A0A9W8LLS0_9FUNG|nr:hypothetical protein H4R18_001172 [Coemansia javaensis]